MVTTIAGNKYESEINDLDLVRNIKKMLNGLDAACNEMIPALEERDVHIREVLEIKELLEWGIDEDDL